MKRILFITILIFILNINFGQELFANLLTYIDAGSGQSSQGYFNKALSSFQTDLYTGQATFQVPIEVPAGRRGIQPNLSLLYQSGGPNTWCGVGWFLDTGSISRSTKSGAPKYDDSDTFVFNFSGSSQELVNTGGSEYRSKIESAFMKFEFNTTNWVVTDKSGTKYYFGQSDNSRQKRGSFDIYSWYLDKVIDVHGNYMLITYQNDQNQIYPQTITYTGNEITAEQPKYSVNFILEDRTDKRINQRSGIRVVTAKRLKEITIEYNYERVRSYKLNYKPISSTNICSLLKSVTLYGKDGITSFPPIEFEYKTLQNAFASATDWGAIENEGQDNRSYIRYDSSDSTAEVAVDLADINGDGLLDRVLANGYNTHWGVQLNNGSGFNPAIQWGPIEHGGNIGRSYIRYGDSYTTSVELADINGDGLPDRLLVINGNSPWKVQLNNGSGFDSAINWGPIENEGYSNRSYIRYDSSDSTAEVAVDLADINGDGLLDRVLANGYNTHWRVQLNNGSGFNPAINWGPIEHGGNIGRSYIRYGDSYVTRVDLADINGDGLPDRISVINGDTYWKVQLNNGSGFDSTTNWGPIEDEGDGAKKYIRYDSSDSSAEIAADLADMNGDGLLDRILANHLNNSWRIQLNNGSGFNPVILWENIGHEGYYERSYIRNGDSYTTAVELADLNGDSLPDRAMRVSSQLWKVQLNQANQPLLSAISNGIGGKIGIVYKSYKGADNTDLQKKSRLPFSVWVIDTITSTDTIRGDSFTTSYSYDSGIYDFDEREFRGFGYVKITDCGGNISETWFHQDDIYKGRIYEQKITASSGGDYTNSVTTWQSELLYNGKAEFPYASQADSYACDGGITKHTHTATQYEFYNNLINRAIVTEGGDAEDFYDDRTTYTEFCHNTSAWIVNLPYETELRDANNITVSKQRIYYDGQFLGVVYNKGLPTKQEAWLDKTAAGSVNRWISSTTQYDNYGNVIKTTDPRGNSITTAYDNVLHQYPATITNTLLHTQQFTYDYSTGQILTSTDPNGGKTTTNEYDSFGRLVKIYGPLDTDGYASVIYEYDLTTTPNRITKKVKTDYGSGNYIITYTFTDGFGRVIQTKSPAEPDGSTQRQIISGAATYDYRGKVKEQYQSYFENSTSASYSTPSYSGPYTSYDYDWLGRVISVVSQNEAGDIIQATTSYSGWSVSSTDFKGNTKDSHYDAYGKLIKVVEHNNYTSYETNYEYDVGGNLVKVTDNAGNVTAISYDSLGRKLFIQDPDMGTWTYSYDDNGNLISQTDAENQTITFAYDALNRLIWKQTPDGTTTYTYDTGTNGRGRLNRVDYNNGSTQFFYDELGREIKTIKTIGGTSYTIERTYDALDRLKTLKYPDNETLTYTYDTSGAVKNIQGLTKSYVQGIEYNAQGQMEKLTYGNNVTTTYNYNNYTKRLTSLRASKGGEAISDLSYAFDNIGNITSLTDAINTATQSFQYDNLNRLTYADNPSGYGSMNYAYDSIGNLTQKGTRYFNYGEGTAGPHALTSSTDGQITCTYDVNGNMLNKSDATHTYDSENRLKKVTKPAQTIHDTFQLQLKTGWNFFSLPVIPDIGYNIADVLSSISGYYTQVTRYNASTQKYESYVGDPEYDQFSTMEYLRGYQIYCIAPCTLTITGSSPTSTHSLNVPLGDNLIGVDITNNGKSAAACFFDIAYSSIKWYNPDTKQLETVSGDDTVYMGRAYYIGATSTSTYSVSALKTITTFTYDGDGGRVQKTVNGVTTTYIGSLFEKEGGVTTRHIFLGDTRICSATSSGGYSFYHGDHLGSTSDVTNQNGALIQHTEYEPYGEESITPKTFGDTTDYLYTSKLLDRSTNLYYYGARYYDPQLGRFTQADTIVPDPANPQSLNRYSYCDGNPINYTDPSGHFKLKEWIGKIAGVTAAVITFAMTKDFSLAMAAYSFISGTIDSYNAGYSVGQSIGIGIASGTAAYIGGKIGGAFGSWAGGGNASASALGSAIFGGAAAGAAGAATHSALTGGNVGLAAGSGAIIGGASGLFMHGLTYKPSATGSSTATSGSSDQVTQTATDGQLQTATDIGQAKGGIEGRMRAEKEIAASALSPYTGTGAEEAQLLHGMETMANEFASEKLKWQIYSKSKDFYFSLTVSERPSDAVLVIDWTAQDVTDVYKLKDFHGILYNSNSNYKLQHIPYEAMEKTFSQ